MHFFDDLFLLPQLLDDLFLLPQLPQPLLEFWRDAVPVFVRHLFLAEGINDLFPGAPIVKTGSCAACSLINGLQEEPHLCSAHAAKPNILLGMHILLRREVMT